MHWQQWEVLPSSSTHECASPAGRMRMRASSPCSPAAAPAPQHGLSSRAAWGYAGASLGPCQDRLPHHLLSPPAKAGGMAQCPLQFPLPLPPPTHTPACRARGKGGNPPSHPLFQTAACLPTGDNACHSLTLWLPNLPQPCVRVAVASLTAKFRSQHSIAIHSFHHSVTAGSGCRGRCCSIGQGPGVSRHTHCTPH